MKNPGPAWLLPVILAAGPVLGADRLALAGAEASDGSYYTYAGVVLPGPGYANGRGVLQRYWIDAFGYEYASGPGVIEADAVGAEASLGYGTSSPKGWASAWAGVRWTDTDLDPDDPGAEARGSQVGLKVDLQGERELAPGWRGNLLASYATEQNGYWTRGRLMRSLGTGRALGGEIVFYGNDESSSRSLGLVFTVQPASTTWTVGFKGGYRDDSETDGIYGGIELGYGF